MMKVVNFLNTTVSAHCLGGRMGVAPAVKGDVLGVELELEGRNVGLNNVPTKGWRREADGSLRGESVEFVFNKPLELRPAKTAVSYLFGKFNENNVRFNDSVRTSTHVHLNFVDHTIKDALNFFFLFTSLEEIMEIYSGEDRAGNLFCLSSRRTEQIMNVLQDCVRGMSLQRFAGDRYKYAACNLSTLFKFGTVEVRTMRGASSADQVNNWLTLLSEMKEYSKKMEAPSDMVANLSRLGGDGFLREIFSANSYKQLMNALPPRFDVHRSILEGMRLIQPCAYEFDEDWRADAPKEVEKDVKEPRGGRGMLRRPAPHVRRLNGDIWVCIGENAENGSLLWQDLECCSDTEEVRWNQGKFCFEELMDGGDWDEEDDWLDLALAR